MIVCSCNVFTDDQFRSVVMKATDRPRMSQIYGHLGMRAQCGRCAHTIKRIMTEILGPHDSRAGRATQPACRGVRDGRCACGLSL